MNVRRRSAGLRGLALGAALLQLALPLAGIVPAAHAGDAALSAPSKAGWRWPVDPRPWLIRKFDPPAKPWLAGHRGIDLAATSGTPI
ncbi:MAG: M23 family peptidase, partial [Actinomycetota bacterium]|nr:M23 family peptidase [Actinomycetota bacterium]